MDDELKRALEDLHDFREFALNNATQWRSGANSLNPMWVRVAETLDRHGMNGGVMGGYKRPDPAYRCV